MQAAAANKERTTVNILGIPVDRTDMASTMAAVERFISEGTPHQIITADSSGLYCQLHDPEFQKILRDADWVTPDSFGVIWAAKKQGVIIPNRVSGVDMVSEACELSAKAGYRIFLLGAGIGVAELAAEKLRLSHPGCNIVGARHGFFPEEDDLLVAEEIAPFKPDILFVAMGIPRQEKFIYKTKSVIGAKAAIGVGGSLDVFSGKAKRAPKIVQKAKLEWLWRLILNPKKYSKAASLPKFMAAVLRQKGS